MLIIIAGGVFIGIKLDQIYINSYYFFTLLFSLASILISLFQVINQVSKDD